MKACVSKHHVTEYKKGQAAQVMVCQYQAGFLVSGWCHRRLNIIISVWCPGPFLGWLHGAGEMKDPLAFDLLGPGTSQSIFYSDLGLSFNDLLKAAMVAVESRPSPHQRQENTPDRSPTCCRVSRTLTPSRTRRPFRANTNFHGLQFIFIFWAN